jgi:hypothetical protein
MTDTTTTVNVAAEFIDAALCAVSKEETRHYLKGVFIDARGFIAATNGHIAFAARCNDAFKLQDCRPAYDSAGHCLPGIIVPSEALTQAIKAAGRAKGLFMVFERDVQGQWWILYGNARVAFTPVDGSFPDWTRIIPTAPETLTAAHYQPQYIAAIGNMAKALRDGKKDATSFFKLHQNGENPALVTFDRKVDDITDASGPRTDCCAVLMPMRTKGDQYAGATFTDTFLKN